MNQLLAMLNKTIRKVTSCLNEIESKQIEETLHIPQKEVRMKELDVDLEDELNEGAEKITKEMKAKHQNLLSSLALPEYAIDGNDKDWEAALGKSGSVPNAISIKSNKKRKFDNSSSASSNQSSKKPKWKSNSKKPQKNRKN